MDNDIKMALAGNPNSGKTTLFNRLTGARQHVGNYPGVTVEKKEGVYIFNGLNIQIIDLPGTYSMTAYSVEEVVARDYLVNEKPDAVINIIDAANLERNLYLSCQFLELGIPTIIALNMVDVAKDRGIKINHARLARLLGVPVVPIIARAGQGTTKLMQAAVKLVRGRRKWRPLVISYGDDLDRTLIEMETRISAARFLAETYPARWIALKYLEGDQQILIKGRQADPQLADDLEKMVRSVSNHLQKTVETYPEALISDHRYGYIKSILRQGVIKQKYNVDRLYTSDKIDKVLTNRLFGPLIMLGVLFGLYQFTFTLSDMPQEALAWFFGWMGRSVTQILPDGPLQSLIVSGIIDGVGGVLGFVPLIMLMFFGISFLEDSGYLARVAFMMDRIFRIFGLHGSSVMSYILSGGIAGGCAVPGVMATRTLRSRKERMATMLTAPFMNCGAKLPILALLTGAFFSKNQAQLMLVFTLISWIIALLAAKFLRLTILRGVSTPFVMELPPYRLPTMRGMAIHTWEKTWQYIKKAGTVILGVSILLWAMMTYPALPQARIAQYEHQISSARAGAYRMPPADNVTAAGNDNLAERINAIEAARQREALRYSLAGRIGIAIEKVSWLTGFDWRTNIALLGGFTAKEVIISSLATAYSLGHPGIDKDTGLAEALGKDPMWNPVMALSLVIFIMFYSPCFVTVVCIARESGSWKWAGFSMAFNTLFAFILATLVFQAGSLCCGLG